MPDDPALLAAKADAGRLCEILGVRNTQHRQDHLKCGLCGHNECFSVFPRDDQWAWKCYSCQEGGTIVDALVKFERKTLKEAMQILGNGHGYTPSRRPPPTHEDRSRTRPVPVLDMKRTMALVNESHAYLLEHPDIVKEYGRGISLEVIKKRKIGFIRNKLMYLYGPNSRPHRFVATWSLPITNAAEVVGGTKFHHERAPIMPNGDEFKGKCSWVPFGTEPQEDREKNIKPNHSFYTLWPHPDTLADDTELISTDPGWWLNQLPQHHILRERYDTIMQSEKYLIADQIHDGREEALTLDECTTASDNAFDQLKDEIQDYVLKKISKHSSDKPDDLVFDPDDYVYILPGELKALAVESDGFRATSCTGGEGWIPPPSMLEPFRGRKIILPYDDDPVIERNGKLFCAGRTWARRMTLALDAANAREVRLLTCGRRQLSAEEMSPEEPPSLQEADL